LETRNAFTQNGQAMKYLRLLLLAMLVSQCGYAAQQDLPKSAQAAKAQSSEAPPQAVAKRSPEVNLLQLQSDMSRQERQIEQQQRALDAIQKKANFWPAVIAALGGIAALGAAAVGGFFAFRNQNEQARQERLLKAVELIMASRSGFQAEIRRKNLEVFLGTAVNKHLENIKDEFAGEEFTDLHLALAQAMSEKATTPAQVLEIWRCVLKGKKFFDRVVFPTDDPVVH
jgi:hypothetical protein